MTKYFYKISAIIQKQLILISFILLIGFNSSLFAYDSESLSSVKYQYAIFYMETEGDFVVAIGADDPAIYSWSEPGKSIKGEIKQIWEFLDIQSEVEYSFTDIESVLLNHVASKGWVFQDLAITSVPTPFLNRNFRTAYRYIFKRAIVKNK